DGVVARVVLAAPKANILDREMVTALEGIFTELSSRSDLRAIVIEAEGPHFSYGASIQEHLPDQIGAALERLSNLLRKIAAAPAPTIAAVRGQCLGGGLELVLACDLIVAEENAHFGVPEIKLGVFPPAASALLPVRLGLARATEIVLTGRTWAAKESHSKELVARLAPDGSLGEELSSWIETEFVPRSPVALRFAVRAIRERVVQALEEVLPRLDRMYIEEMMPLGDAEEGIRAFLEKRPAAWSKKEEEAAV
ncbi:MAG: enoyl-CoA hydratase/isomerase family protein, partial [Thermoanaerobaculia bacterium]|nr:enoyl-CoA hydratase/isomerase family protein [Thermoanaerobaculia bacterium]